LATVVVALGTVVVLEGWVVVVGGRVVVAPGRVVVVVPPGWVVVLPGAVVLVVELVVVVGEFEPTTVIDAAGAPLGVKWTCTLKAPVGAAARSRVSVTVTEAPAASEPEAGETVSQGTVEDAVQVEVFCPVSVRTT